MVACTHIRASRRRCVPRPPLDRWHNERLKRLRHRCRLQRQEGASTCCFRNASNLSPGQSRGRGTLQTFPEALFRAVVAIEVLAVALVWMALAFNAPLEGVADPSHTPNPAKAPWYFLGLQEMLHYFPPVVAGVLAPGLVVIALIIIPYFNINIEAEGVFLKDRARRLKIFYAAAAVLSIFLFLFHVYV